MNNGVLPKRIFEVWQNITIDNYNGNFKFSTIDSNSRRREFQDSFNFLKLAGLIYEVRTDRNIRYIPVDLGFLNTLTANSKINEKNIHYLYALSCFCRKYPIVKIVDEIIYSENKSNQIPFQCMSNIGVKKYLKNPFNELLVHFKMSDSNLTNNVLQLPVYFADDVSKFYRTALKQIDNNYFPEKRAGDFY